MSSDEALDAFYGALLDDDPVQLYDRAPCGYLSTTPDGTIVKVNETFLTWTGYARQDLVGRRTFSELLTAGGRIYHETHYAPMLRMQGEARQIALDIVKADGQRLPALVNAVVHVDAEGAPVIVRTAVFDATDRRAYERELVRARQRAEASEQQAVLLARTLQQTLIPPAPPTIPGLHLSAAYRPAGGGEEVGGDFYDVFSIGRDDWVITVGDVRGKGAGAAVVTALARHTIRAAAIEHGAPAAILASLNRALLLDETDRFCSAAVGRCTRADGRWTVATACGGHPLPVLARADGPPALHGRPGTLLGVLPEVDFAEDAVELRPGDSLLLYTDGVTEARGADGFYDEARLLESVARHRDEPDICAPVLHEVLAFQRGQARDDIAMVGIRVP